MKEQLINIQSQTDSLRLKLKHKIRFDQFDGEFDKWMSELKRLDDLFMKLVKESGTSLNRFGRLV